MRMKMTDADRVALHEANLADEAKALAEVHAAVEAGKAADARIKAANLAYRQAGASVSRSRLKLPIPQPQTHFEVLEVREPFHRTALHDAGELSNNDGALLTS